MRPFMPFISGLDPELADNLLLHCCQVYMLGSFWILDSQMRILHAGSASFGLDQGQQTACVCFWMTLEASIS